MESREERREEREKRKDEARQWMEEGWGNERKRVGTVARKGSREEGK